jgi:hypothetical protein
MLIEEAQWLNQNLNQINSDDLYPMCNIGSSTEHYRRVEQSYVDKYLFAPARAKNLQVIHVDAKPAPGVDVVGDLTDPSILARLAPLNVRSIMCCNLLEHVTERALIANAILSMLKVGGYIIASVPFYYPYHADPIDTMYRPTLTELISLFPGTKICRGAVLPASAFTYTMNRSYQSLLRTTVRASIPFYRPRSWWRSMETLCQIATGYKVTCAILRKTYDISPPSVIRSAQFSTALI